MFIKIDRTGLSLACIFLEKGINVFDDIFAPTVNHSHRCPEIRNQFKSHRDLHCYVVGAEALDWYMLIHSFVLKTGVLTILPFFL